MIINYWNLNLDPLVNSIITDIIKIIIKNKYTNQRIEERLMPTLISILNSTLSQKSEETNLSGFITVFYQIAIIVVFLSFLKVGY